MQSSQLLPTPAPPMHYAKLGLEMLFFYFKLRDQTKVAKLSGKYLRELSFNDLGTWTYILNI